MKKAVILALLLSTSIVLGLSTTQFIQKHGLTGLLFESKNVELNVFDSKGILVKRNPEIGDLLTFETKGLFTWRDWYLLDDDFNIIVQGKLIGNYYLGSNWVQNKASTEKIDTKNLKTQSYHFVAFICNLHQIWYWATKGIWDCKWEVKSTDIKKTTPPPPGPLPKPKGKYGLNDPNNLGPKTNPNIPCVRPNDGDKIDKDTVLCKDVYKFKKGLQIVKNGITLDCNGATLDGDDNGVRSEKGIWIEKTGSYQGGGVYCKDKDRKDKITIKNCNMKNYNTAMDLCIGESFLLNNKLERNNIGIALDDSRKGTQLIEKGDNTIKNNIFMDNGIGFVSIGTHNNLLENNLFEKNSKGAYAGEYYHRVFNNLFKTNLVGLITCCRTQVKYNEFLDNGHFVSINSVTYSDVALYNWGEGAIIRDNYFKDNSRAIGLIEGGSVIEDNIIEDSKVGGIVFEATTSFYYKPSIIKNNLIENNPYGVYMFKSTQSKTPQRATMMYNDLIDNKVQVFSDFENFIDKNYYSDYSPTCVNSNPKDDYCDIPRDVAGGVTKDRKPLAVTASSLRGKRGSANCVTPSDGMQIINDTKFCPGFYNLKKGVEITKDNIVLDCDGATLNGLIRQINQQGGITYIVGHSGILIDNVNNVEIKNCNLEFYKLGIGSLGSYNSNIHNNEVTLTGVGVFLINNENTKVHNNRMISNYEGVEIARGEVNEVNNNFMMFNTIGVAVVTSSENNIHDNEIYYSRFATPVTVDSGSKFNTNGIAVVLTMKSEKNKVTNNLMDHNKIGVFVEDSNNNLVKDNVIQYSIGGHSSSIDGFGILLEKGGGSVIGNSFIHNTIQYNDNVGVLVEEFLGGAVIKDNKFLQNNFIKNGVHEVDDYPNQWDDGKLGNYWDDHVGAKCNDSDGDGICNNPRPINSGAGLSSNKNDNYPSANRI